MRVFISSTCYDLIDLRAEVESFFQQAGVTPILSDSLTSEFQVMPDRNSVETCLANVRTSDAFIIILSNRYGPSLANAGFADISATHLEYREAVHRQIPTRMYVRDRLEADYNIWRKNHASHDLQLAWCKDTKDRKLFELLEEHRPLEQGKQQTNWYWLFRDSVELKQRLALDFKETFTRVAADRLFGAGRLPHLEVGGRITGRDSQWIQMEIHVRNIGKAVAVTPELQFEDRTYQFSSLAEQEKPTFHWQCLAPRTGSILNQAVPTRLNYSTLEGHKFVDEGSLTIYCELRTPEHLMVRYALKKRQYLGCHTEMLLA
ncbi:MAG: DUF4062 domain-containing protein [Verrucomicrobia bacterium]|nr:DUF4062 domain-containing protein [Verrucomicrobiota bacterium]